jgi:hypothetical protein
VRFFETAREKRAHFSRMLAEQPLGVPIPPPDDGDLRDLIELHPDAAALIGAGVDYFWVGENPPFGSRGFQIRRVDGSHSIFSYPMCLTGKRPPPLQELSHALRIEVRDDIQAAKIECFEQSAINGRIVCPETGHALAWNEADADHAAPFYFAVLVKGFLASRGITPGYELVEKYNGVRRLKDRRLADEWCKYHHRLANIRLVDAKWNRRDSANSKTKSGVFLKLVGGAGNA